MLHLRRLTWPLVYFGSCAEGGCAALYFPRGLSWLFHKVDIDKVKSIIEQGVDYRYIAAMMVITILSHIIRCALGHSASCSRIPRIPAAVAESVSIFGAYALNLVFPLSWRGVALCLHSPARELQAVDGCRHRPRRPGIGCGDDTDADNPDPDSGAGGYIDKFLDRYPMGKGA